MCHRNEVVQSWLGHRTLLLWFCATIDSKRQSTVERGISGEHAGARFVYNICDPGFSTNWLCPCQWGRGKGEKAVLCGSPPASQAMFVPNNIGFDRGWSCFSLILLFLLPFFLFFLFVLFFLLVAKTGPEYWLNTKAGGKHLDSCSLAEVSLSLGTGVLAPWKGNMVVCLRWLQHKTSWIMTRR